MDIEKFAQAVASLKLAHRAELKDSETDDPLIEELYVDLGQRNEVLDLLKTPSSTILLGRRGAGKSTLFQRMQSDLRKSRIAICAYLDVKSLAKMAKMVEPALRKLSETDPTIDVPLAQNALASEAFITDIAQELVRELSVKAGGFLGSLAEAFTGSREQAVAEIGNLMSAQRYSLSKNVAAFERVKRAVNRIEEETDQTVVAAVVKASVAPVMGAGAGRIVMDRTEQVGHTTRESTHVNLFDFRAFCADLVKVLAKAHIRHLYLFIDDFSDLESEMMALLVDNIIEPLTTAAPDMIKIKLAAYPHRLWLGRIDQSKWDQIVLDPYDRYGASNDIAQMERLATDFLRRLLTKRVRHYCNHAPEDYFDPKEVADNIWAALYRATFGVPRMIGFVLHNIIADCLHKNEKITVRAINEAAKKAYNERIEVFFRGNAVGGLPLDDLYSTPMSHQSLLNAILKHAHSVRTDNDPARSVPLRAFNNLPTSHFVVDERLEPVLAALEMNSVLTRYGKRKDKDGTSVVLYAFNYGLCLEQGIPFLDSRQPSHNALLNERRLNYTTTIDNYLRRSTSIRCPNGHVEPLDALSHLQKFGMLCPHCLKENLGQVVMTFVPVAQEFPLQIAEGIAARVKERTGQQICDILYREGRAMTSAEIGEEIDLAGKDVGPFARNLLDLKLLERGRPRRGKNTYLLSDEAKVYYQTN
ncbi:MAG: hypothetical protein U0361_25160 [Nitrospiraceae bacterium]